MRYTLISHCLSCSHTVIKFRCEMCALLSWVTSFPLNKLNSGTNYTHNLELHCILRVKEVNGANEDKVCT